MMRTDYFADLIALPETVTAVTAPQPAPVTASQSSYAGRINKLGDRESAVTVVTDVTAENMRRRRYAYCYKLRGDEGGGTYLTNAQTISAARDELMKVYGSRLAVVATWNQD